MAVFEVSGRDSLRQFLITPRRPAVSTVDAIGNSADKIDKDNESDNCQRHLPGDIEDRFECGLHKQILHFRFAHIESSKMENLSVVTFINPKLLLSLWGGGNNSFCFQSRHNISREFSRIYFNRLVII